MQTRGEAGTGCGYRAAGGLCCNATALETGLCCITHEVFTLVSAQCLLLSVDQVLSHCRPFRCRGLQMLRWLQRRLHAVCVATMGPTLMVLTLMVQRTCLWCSVTTQVQLCIVGSDMVERACALSCTRKCQAAAEPSCSHVCCRESWYVQCLKVFPLLSLLCNKNYVIGGQDWGVGGQGLGSGGAAESGGFECCLVLHQKSSTNCIAVQGIVQSRAQVQQDGEL